MPVVRIRMIDIAIAVGESDDPDPGVAAYGNVAWDEHCRACEAEFRRLMATDPKFRRFMEHSARSNAHVRT